MDKKKLFEDMNDIVHMTTKSGESYILKLLGSSGNLMSSINITDNEDIPTRFIFNIKDVSSMEEEITNYDFYNDKFVTDIYQDEKTHKVTTKTGINPNILTPFGYFKDERGEIKKMLEESNK